VAAGMEAFDAALCLMFGWDVNVRVSFRTLRDDHGFPDDWAD
jgi:hypothetical protein